MYYTANTLYQLCSCLSAPEYARVFLRHHATIALLHWSLITFAAVSKGHPVLPIPLFIWGRSTLSIRTAWLNHQTCAMRVKLLGSPRGDNCFTLVAHAWFKQPSTRMFSWKNLIDPQRGHKCAYTRFFD